MSDIADVPPAVVGRLRVICGELPEAYEEPAWIGLRWRIRRRTFLHVYTTDGRGSAYIDMDDPAILMTFRVPPGELAALAHAGPPFFRADWGVNVVGMVLDDETDWVEVAELVTDSYRVQAPRRLCDGLAGEQQWDVLLEAGDFRADSNRSAAGGVGHGPGSVPRSSRFEAVVTGGTGVQNEHGTERS